MPRQPSHARIHARRTEPISQEACSDYAVAYIYCSAQAAVSNSDSARTHKPPHSPYPRSTPRLPECQRGRSGLGERSKHADPDRAVYALLIARRVGTPARQPSAAVRTFAIQRTLSRATRTGIDLAGAPPPFLHSCRANDASPFILVTSRGVIEEPVGGAVLYFLLRSMVAGRGSGVHLTDWPACVRGAYDGSGARMITPTGPGTMQRGGVNVRVVYERASLGSASSALSAP